MHRSKIWEFPIGRPHSLAWRGKDSGPAQPVPAKNAGSRWGSGLRIFSIAADSR